MRPGPSAPAPAPGPTDRSGATVDCRRRVPALLRHLTHRGCRRPRPAAATAAGARAALQRLRPAALVLSGLCRRAAPPAAARTPRRLVAPAAPAPLATAFPVSAAFAPPPATLGPANAALPALVLLSLPPQPILAAPRQLILEGGSGACGTPPPPPAAAAASLPSPASASASASAPPPRRPPAALALPGLQPLPPNLALRQALPLVRLALAPLERRRRLARRTLLRLALLLLLLLPLLPVPSLPLGLQAQRKLCRVGLSWPSLPPPASASPSAGRTLTCMAVMDEVGAPVMMPPAAICAAKSCWNRRCISASCATSTPAASRTAACCAGTCAWDSGGSSRKHAQLVGLGKAKSLRASLATPVHAPAEPPQRVRRRAGPHSPLSPLPPLRRCRRPPASTWPWRRPCCRRRRRHQTTRRARAAARAAAPAGAAPAPAPAAAALAAGRGCGPGGTRRRTRGGAAGPRAQAACPAGDAAQDVTGGLPATTPCLPLSMPLSMPAAVHACRCRNRGAPQEADTVSCLRGCAPPADGAVPQRQWHSR